MILLHKIESLKSLFEIPFQPFLACEIFIISINLPARRDGPSYAMRERWFVFSLARSRWSLEHTENTEKLIVFGLIR